jgi:glycosyltransferase involved in cell wall biosynthesis
VTDVPSVSVIIPAFNSVATIARAIDSVLSQKYPGLEIVVADDGSTDTTREVAAACGSAVRVVSRQHAGPAAARNLGIRSSTGEYVAFLDSDDEWLPGRLSKCIEPMRREKSVGMTWCRAIQKSPDGREGIRNARSPSHNKLHRLLWPSPLQCTPATTCRRSALDRVGVFDESLKSREDKDLWIRIGEQFDSREISEPLVVVHERPDSYVASNQYNLAQIRADYFAVIEKALKRCPDRYAVHRNAILAEAHRYWGRYALYYGISGEARPDLARSMRLYPSPVTAVYLFLSVMPESAIEALRKLYRML